MVTIGVVRLAVGEFCTAVRALAKGVGVAIFKATT